MKSGITMPTHTQVLAHVIICNGCCCGNIEKDYFPIPVDYIKVQWLKRRLTPHINLTFSDCLTICNTGNTVAIMTKGNPIWLGKMNSSEKFEALIAWAEQTAKDGNIAPMPRVLAENVIENRFR